MKLKAMLEKKASLQKEMRAMSEKLEAETRAWTPDEEKKFRELTDEVKRLTDTINALQEARELADDEVEQQETDGETTTAKKKEDTEAAETRAFAAFLRAIITGDETRNASNLTMQENGAIVPKTIVIVP